jgi:hypothetical protein
VLAAVLSGIGGVRVCLVVRDHGQGNGVAVACSCSSVLYAVARIVIISDFGVKAIV